MKTRAKQQQQRKRTKKEKWGRGRKLGGERLLKKNKRSKCGCEHVCFSICEHRQEEQEFKASVSYISKFKVSTG